MEAAARPDSTPEWQRMSASRVATFQRCPRAYYYRYVRFYPQEDRPILRFGHAVESAVLAGLSSPPPVEAGERLDTLLAWAHDVAVGRVPATLEAERVAWSTSANRMGNWDRAIDPTAAHAMAGRIYSPAFHGRMVEACLATARGDWLGAWALARPRFRRLDGPAFSGQASVPLKDPWFSGAFDLWYVHGGRSEIVDLKASRRGGLFAQQYQDQLAAYSFIHRELLGRAPDALALWYLGEDEPVEVAVPPPTAIDEFVRRARTILEESLVEEPNEDDYPPEPASIDDVDPASGSPGRTWCALCDFRALCPRTRAESAPQPTGQPLAELGRAGALVTLRAQVAGVRREKINPNSGMRHLRVVLADASGACEMTLFNEQIDLHREVLLRRRLVDIELARVDVFRGRAGLVCERSTRIHPVAAQPASPPERGEVRGPPLVESALLDDSE